MKEREISCVLLHWNGNVYGTSILDPSLCGRPRGKVSFSFDAHFQEFPLSLYFFRIVFRRDLRAFILKGIQK